MLLLALKNLVQERTRLIISIGGVAFSVLLIVTIQALYQGWSDRVGEYIRTVPADYWIAQEGASNMFHTPSVLPLSLRSTIEAVPGVETAKPFSGRSVAFDHNGKTVDIYVIADDPENHVGAPERVVEGKGTPGTGEIIIDRVTARSEGIRLGDTIPLAGNSLKVVGFSEGGYVLSASFAFATQQDVEKILQLPDSTNFYLLTLAPGADGQAVADRIHQVAGVDAIPKATFVANNVAIVQDTFLPIIMVLVVIGIIVGMTVVGLTIFTSTIEKSREYGVLKALGVSNRQLYAVVVEQALAAAVVGYALGAALAFGVDAVAADFVPAFLSKIRPVDLAWIFGVTLAMAVVSAFLPASRLARIDPAEVFRA